MTGRDVVLAASDATLERYERTFDRLTLHLTMWDETAKVVTAEGVTTLVDAGTWEVDAIVRVTELDDADLTGYGIVDVEGNVTLRFAARSLEW